MKDLKSIKKFIEENLYSENLTESLHPDLQKIVEAPTTNVSKQTLLSKTIRKLKENNQETGLEGNMPKGSSRAYLKHKEKYPIKVDGKDTHIETGIKVAIKSNLDKHFENHHWGTKSLGHLQNEAENNDGYVDKRYRILTHEKGNEYSSNEEHGIFPPLIHHDEEEHEWSHVGHAKDLDASKFKHLTKNKDFPKGITHSDFVGALERDWNRNNGKHWKGSNEKESHLDKIEKHPLVQKFLDHQREMDFPPHDWKQKKNLGTIEVNGKEHIVGRDHGFNHTVMDAYHNARTNMFRRR